MKHLFNLRNALWAAVLLLAVGTAFAAAWMAGTASQGAVSTASIGGPFSLIDQNGATVTEAALKGHASAMFFGYTFCPDVCPTTLADVTTWLKTLGPEADKLKVYFVTVDPERDTPEQMASYLTAFDPRIVGLTGPRPAVDKILKDYRVYSRKVPGIEGNYAMDHTASVLLLDQNGAFTGTVDYTDPSASVLTKLKRLIEAG